MIKIVMACYVDILNTQIVVFICLVTLARLSYLSLADSRVLSSMDIQQQWAKSNSFHWEILP